MATKKPEKVKTKKGKWLWPIPSTRQTQGFGGSHHGRDYGVPTGSSLVAPTKGKVVFAGKDSSGYGNLIKIQTDTGETVYLAHLSQINVKVGQSVDPGQLIGKTGNTGNSTGPHLHYEVREGSTPVDPLAFYGVGSMVYTGAKAGQAKVKESVAGAKSSAAAAVSGAVSSASPGTLIGDILSEVNVNWGNVIAAVVGIALIVIGGLGLVGGEALKGAVQSIKEPVKEAVK